VTRGLSPIIGLLAALLPAMAHAQTNLDQGKSASQIFTAICAECHKAPRALANGKNNAALTDFLVEHYTTSRSQAAALAAYVLGGRGGEPIGGTQKKPPTERASAEEPKPGKPKPGKPEEGASAKPKPQRPTEANAKAKDDANSGEVPGVLNPIVRPEGSQRPSAATRNRRPEPKPAAAPADGDAVARAPAASTPPAAPNAAPPAAPNAAPAATPSPAPRQDATPATAAVPADTGAGDNAPVPRDSIAD
jgi:hypothetical protein